MSKSTFLKKIISKLGIAVGIIVFLIIILMIFNKNLEKLAAKSRELNQEIIARSNSIQRVSEFRAAYAGKAGAYLNVLYNVIPQKDELINLSKEIQTVADSENLSFGFSFVGETQPTESQLGSVAFSVSLEGGNFDNIINFIKKFENFRYFIQMEDFSISSSGKKANIRGRVFFR